MNKNPKYLMNQISQTKNMNLVKSNPGNNILIFLTIMAD